MRGDMIIATGWKHNYLQSKLFAQPRGKYMYHPPIQQISNQIHRLPIPRNIFIIQNLLLVERKLYFNLLIDTFAPDNQVVVANCSSWECTVTLHDNACKLVTKLSLAINSLWHER